MLLVVLVVINGIIETSRAGGWDHRRRPSSEAGVANGANKVDRADLALVLYFIYSTMNKARGVVPL